MKSLFYESVLRFSQKCMDKKLWPDLYFFQIPPSGPNLCRFPTSNFKTEGCVIFTIEKTFILALVLFKTFFLMKLTHHSVRGMVGKLHKECIIWRKKSISIKLIWIISIVFLIIWILTDNWKTSCFWIEHTKYNFYQMSEIH